MDSALNNLQWEGVFRKTKPNQTKPNTELSTKILNSTELTELVSPICDFVLGYDTRLV